MVRTVAFALGLLTLTGAARGETILEGDRDALSVTTHDAAIEEVLGALAGKFGLRYRIAEPLTRRLNSTYACPLQRCVAQILAGYDYIIRSDAQGIEIMILGAGGAPKTGGTGSAFAGRTARRAD